MDLAYSRVFWIYLSFLVMHADPTSLKFRVYMQPSQLLSTF